jgi:thiamine-phosphate pyrophosphorylase
MSRPQPMKQAPKLYLMTPAIGDAVAFGRELAAALGAAEIAAVLLRLADADEATQIDRIKTLAPLLQPKDIALLLDGHAELVARSGADGAHLTGIDAFASQVGTLKPQRIAGCGGLATRHDAMTAAERGADYVMFGDAADGARPSFEAIVDRVAWWAEVFEVPCVALATSLDEAGALAAAGADFIAVGDFIWSEPGGAVAALAATAQRIALPETVA